MDYKEEAFLFIVQIFVLLVFAFLLKDILAALIVSLFSRPLAKMASKWLNKNLEKRKKKE